LGAFLSGGIDSSIVVALMSGMSGSPVKTFSIGFDDSSYNELPYARALAERYGTDHHEFIVRPQAVELLPGLVRLYGEPFADSSALPTYYVAQMSRRYVTVALNGDAGDELFAGYMRYYAFTLGCRMGALPGIRTPARWLEDALKRAPRRSLAGRVRRFMQSLQGDDFSRYLSLVEYFGAAGRARLYTGELARRVRAFDAEGYLRNIYDTAPARDELGRILLLDLQSYLPEDLLVKVDIASMAHSLEARSPFLDHRLVEFAVSLPSEWKLRGRKGKYILKDTFRNMLPAEIVRRGKMGFGVPVSEWFRRELREYLREILFDRKTLDRGYFDPAEVRRLVDCHVAGSEDNGYRLWALLVLELWHRAYIDG
jgi:asparagine synthase (glutamine-hydrolysing)